MALKSGCIEASVIFPPICLVANSWGYIFPPILFFYFFIFPPICLVANSWGYFHWVDLPVEMVYV